MLHGLYRSRHCLRGPERRIQGSGLDVVAPNHPSGHADLATPGARLNDLMAEFGAAGRWCS